MNEEVDESEFYHQDFTTASEWEVFIARMEEIINQWKTEESSLSPTANLNSDIWEVKNEKLSFNFTDFNLYFYKKRCGDVSQSSDDVEKLDKSPIDSLYDFELYKKCNDADHSCISTWYGLNEFVVLSTDNNVAINSENVIKILLSSIYVVSSNVNGGRPIFVQVREKWQNCYLGVHDCDGIRTNFEMIHLRRRPPNCQYLSGLLDLFKTKVMSPCSIDGIIVSVQNTYNLTDFGNFIWKQDTLDNDNFDPENLYILPFGVTVDPISSISLKTTWNHLIDNLIIDSEGYTDFDAMAAQKWSFLTKMTNEPVCLLGDVLTEFQQNLNNYSTVYDILSDIVTATTTESNPLDLLTEPAVPTISTLLSRAARHSLTKTRKGNPPISENVLVSLLYFLFPDADEKSSFPYGGKEDKEYNENSNGSTMFKNIEEEFKGYKTCCVDSLLWRLSIVLAHALQSLGGVRAFTHIWYEFVQEMRYRWEKSLPIPGLVPGHPDLRTCLLNQKLQMLNCCIDRKLARENTQRSAYDSAENSSDDEFFDCAEKLEDDSRKKHSLWNQPVGRLGKFGDLKLIKTGDPIYIPVTQELVLKTEDQLDEDTDVLLRLGSDAGAAELRARIMSASLLSDMESFKAANPGSMLDDFIRWYSPRDWVEEEELDEWGQKKGHLSQRMLIEENIWVQMWEAAKPVPANRQKRLFDDTKEAEKILHYLDFRTVAQICESIIPVLSHASIYRLIDEFKVVNCDITESNVSVLNLVKQGARLSRESKFQVRRFESFIQELTALELLVSQINSLQYKLNPSGINDAVVSATIADLVLGNEVEIEGTSECNMSGRLVSMFSEAQRNINLTPPDAADDKTVINSVFNSPNQREFVLRVNAVRPASYSAKCPQFLRAIVNKNEFRLAGAFSEDVVFF